MQRGFLGGRSLLANVIDVDHEALRVTLHHQRGAIVLFDFAAAFPSISHEFMFEVLESVGVPRKLLNLIKAMYDNVRCSFTINGGKQDGFSLHVGTVLDKRVLCPH